MAQMQKVSAWYIDKNKMLTQWNGNRPKHNIYIEQLVKPEAIS